MFGEFVKKIRMDRRIGLREFCIAADCDPSNWSKVERGLMPPPQSRKILVRIAVALGITNDLKQVDLLMDYAAISVGKIPQHVMKDSEFVKRLPIFFRMANGKKPTPKFLAKLVEQLKEPPTPYRTVPPTSKLNTSMALPRHGLKSLILAKNVIGHISS
jgi:transcriptional regulator with XRE-family HTH domain